MRGIKNSKFAKESATFLERVLANYFETNRSIRELSQYYKIPKSTIHDWIQRAQHLLPYDTYNRYQQTAQMHLRKNWFNQEYEEYIKTDDDGSYD